MLVLNAGELYIFHISELNNTNIFHTFPSI